jgi:transcriptional regulator with XRE-family HTH domain
VLSLIEQLQTARKRAKWSVQKLLDESGLELERSTLSRKLNGECPVTSGECESLANALGVTLVVMPDEGKP